MPSSLFSNPSYTRIKALGSGSEGRADLYSHVPSNRLLAVKIVCREPRNKTRQDYIPQEARILELLAPYKHPGIVQFLGVEAHMPQPGSDAIVLEYCNGGDLQAFKDRYTEAEMAVPESLVWSVLGQIADAVAFLHTGYGTAGYTTELGHSSRRSLDSGSGTGIKTWIPILHRDIKPSNILLSYHPSSSSSSSFPQQSNPTNPSQEITFKLADFGTAAQIPHRPWTHYTSPATGTPDYAPPEYPLITPAADIWALGATIHFLCLGEPPVDSLAVDVDPVSADITPSTNLDPESGSRGEEELSDEAWRLSLPRRAIRVDLPPACLTRQESAGNGVEGRRSQWGFVGNAGEAWEGVYSGVLQGVLERVLDVRPEGRVGAVDLVEGLRLVGK